jgi:hypothetical protein
MVAQIKAPGAFVELITNGTLLDERRARGLIATGLDYAGVACGRRRSFSAPEVILDFGFWIGEYGVRMRSGHHRTALDLTGI